jgi:hypothetical protein
LGGEVLDPYFASPEYTPVIDCVGLAGSVVVVNVASSTPLFVMSVADPKTVAPLLNVILPVGAGVLPCVADTTAVKVTFVPTRTGPTGPTVSKVLVGFAGGGGSGSGPCSVMVATLPEFPENRLLIVPVASPQLPADDDIGKVGIVKLVARKLTVCVPVLYGIVES